VAVAVSVEPPQPEQLASPCVGTCRLDPATGWCVGCGRDAGELTGWRDFDAAERAAVWAALPERLRQLGRDCRLLPWAPADALAGIAMLAKSPGAVLVTGVEGAVAEFMAGPGSTVLTRQYGDVLELRTSGARARLVAHPGLRVFQGGGRMALTLHRSRFRPMPSVITALGPDGEALRAADRSATLVDLGLGRPGFRFAVRLADRALVDLARRHLGRRLLDDAHDLVAALVAAAPTRVLTTPLGRVEIDGPIERADHDGPHTHLLPEYLAAGRQLRSGLALPEAYVAAALVLQPETPSTARASI
jgi:predicted Fe-S protein YdhL (DUF1289 family)